MHDHDPRLPDGDDLDDMRHVVDVATGEHYLAHGDEVVSATVGASVCICARDPALGIGGLTHFLLSPEHGAPAARSQFGVESMRLTNLAIEHLFTAIHKRGGRRERVEVMVFGAGQIHSGSRELAEHNRSIVCELLEIEGMRVKHTELGGQMPRIVTYDPMSGQVQVVSASDIAARAVAEYERRFVEHKGRPPADDIQLF